MNTRIVSHIVGVALLLFAAEVCHADSILDQSYDPSSTGSTAYIGQSNVVDWAQTFTVGTTGFLTSVEVKILRKSSEIVDPLLFDLRSTSSGAPAEADSGTAILFNTSVSASSISTSAGFLTIGLGSGGVQVDSGDVLAMVLRSDDSASGAYQWKGTSTSGYSGGSAFDRIGSSGTWGGGFAADLAFKTNLTPTPEPASIVMFGLGALGVAWLRRRRRRRPS
jgi:hypothetical protein